MSSESIYVTVYDADENVRTELPTNENGSLSTQTLKSAFPEATGLKYFINEKRVFRAIAFDKSGKNYIAPNDGWTNKLFKVIFEVKKIHTWNTVEEPLPRMQEIIKYLFYIESNENKSNVNYIGHNFFVTFAHGPHSAFNVNEEIQVVSIDELSSYTSTIKFISTTQDFIILKSNSKVMVDDPSLCNFAYQGMPIFLCGFGNNFEKLSINDGRIYMEETKVFKEVDGEESIGPFILGTVYTHYGDSTAAVWSAYGLVAITLGFLGFPKHPHNNAIEEAAHFKKINYMTSISRVIEEVKKLEVNNSQHKNKNETLIKIPGTERLLKNI